VCVCTCAQRTFYLATTGAVNSINFGGKTLAIRLCSPNRSWPQSSGIDWRNPIWDKARARRNDAQKSPPPQDFVTALENCWPQ